MKTHLPDLAPSSSHHLLFPLLSKSDFSSQGAAPEPSLPHHSTSAQPPPSAVCMGIPSGALGAKASDAFLIPLRPPPRGVCSSACPCAARGPSSGAGLGPSNPHSHIHKLSLDLSPQTLVSSCLVDIASPNISDLTSKPKLLSLSRAWPSLLFSSCHQSDTTSSKGACLIFPP